MVPPTSDKEPNPLYGYVVSFVRLHECGFTSPASRFMRGLCHHYGVELHNFAPNVILQAAFFATVYEGFLGSRRTGTSGSISSVASFTLLPHARRGHDKRFTPAALRSCCGIRAESCTHCAP
jgi:hypothetical protein